MRLFLLALVVAGLDQTTKALVEASLVLGESRPVLGGVLRLTHVRNPGAAFGLLAYQTELLAGAGLVALAAVVRYRREIAAHGWPVRLGIALGLGGALGNLICRLHRGVVVDFIDLTLLPVFNVADMAIVAGIGLLAAGMLRAAPASGKEGA